MLIFLEVLFVVSLDYAPVLVGQEFIQNMGVVVEPPSAPDGQCDKERSSRSNPERILAEKV